MCLHDSSILHQVHKNALCSSEKGVRQINTRRGIFWKALVAMAKKTHNWGKESTLACFRAPRLLVILIKKGQTQVSTKKVSLVCDESHRLFWGYWVSDLSWQGSEVLNTLEEKEGQEPLQKAGPEGLVAGKQRARKKDWTWPSSLDRTATLKDILPAPRRQNKWKWGWRITVNKEEINVFRKLKEIHSKFLIPSQIFKCKLHVITIHPNLGKTQTPSIGWH